MTPATTQRSHGKYDESLEAVRSRTDDNWESTGPSKRGRRELCGVTQTKTVFRDHSRRS